MTFVKICGITNLSDALAAVQFGVDALGFNFYKPSPRYISPDDARQIISQLPKDVLPVGVFVNETTEQLEAIAKKSGVRALQLHGDESPEDCALLKTWYRIKALHVDEKFAERSVLDYDVDAIMLDARTKKLRGGTGHVIDWSVAQKVNTLNVKLFLAGGLSPENVSQAVTTVGPYAVDACSSLERRPGEKDHARMELFLKAVRKRSDKL